jgi:hypothetical protein
MLNKSGLINISMEVLFVVVVGVSIYTLFGALIFEPVILILMYLAYAGLRYMVKNNVKISWKGLKDYVYK